MAKEKINVVKIDTDPAKKSLKDLRKELMEIRNEMVNLEEGSDAFLEMAQKGGELQHQIQEIGESIKGASSDFGDMVGNATNAMAGITGAFQAVAGGLQAMGMESEALDKTIAKMQGLMAVTDGLSKIDDGIKSFNKLTKAIDGTTKAGKVLKVVMQPKVLLAVAAVISAIVLAFKNWEGAIRNALPFVDKICNAFGRVHPDIKKATEEQEKFNKKLAEEYAIIKAQQDETASEADKIRLQRRLDKLTDEAKAKLRVAQEDIILVQDEYNKALAKRTEVVMSGDAWALRVLDAQLRGYTKTIEKNKKIVDSIMKDKKWEKKNTPTTPTTPTENNDLGLVEFTDKDLQEGLDRVRKYYEELYNIKLEQNKRSNKSNIETLKEEIAIEEQRLTLYQEGTIEHEKQLTKISDLKNELNGLANSWKEAIQTPQEKYNQELAALNELKDAKLLTDEEYVRAKKQLDQELADWEKQLNQEIANDKKEKMQATLQVTAAGFNAIGSIMSELANKENAETKESFEKQKKLQIAAATMSMLTGIINAWTSAMALPSPWNFIQAGIDTAATAALGAIQISKIKQQQFGGTGSTPGTSSGATAAMIVPPVQYSNAVQGANTEGAIRDSKVYVTETDIKNTMNKVSVQENENIY